MVRQNFGRNQTGQEDAVPATASARAYAVSLERIERSRGATQEDARRSIARRLRVGFGTFNNIVRDRVKRIDERIRDRLHVLLVHELEAEIARLSHDLETVRRSGGALGSDEVREIETHLAAVRQLMGSRKA